MNYHNFKQFQRLCVIGYYPAQGGAYIYMSIVDVLGYKMVEYYFEEFHCK